MMNTTDLLNQKRLELADLQTDLSKFKALLESNEKAVTTAKAEKLEPSKIVELQTKVTAVERLISDQEKAIAEVTNEVQTLEHQSNVDSVITTATNAIQNISTTYQEIEQLMNELERTLEPFKEKFAAKWQEWSDKREKYFEVANEATTLELYPREARTEYNLMAFETLLKAKGIASEIVRKDLGFSSGWGSYNETYLLEHPDPLVSDIANQFTNLGWYRRVKNGI